MISARTLIRLLLVCLPAPVCCWGQLSQAQQYYPQTGSDPGLVNYQITPLPPINEGPALEQLIAPAANAPAAPAAPATPVAEEVPPPAPDAAAAKPAEGEKPAEGDKAAGDAKDAKTDAEIIPVEEQSLFYIWRLWEVGFELGVNGSVGNADTHTWRTAIRSKRKTDTSVLTADVDYKKSMQESQTTADRLFSEYRAEFPNSEDKWSTYTHGTVEFDAFRAYDARLTNDIGVGYQWYKTDVGSFITRTGAGTSREFGGPDDHWVPEGVVGAVYERKLSRKQKLSFSSEFFFDWTNFGENRANTKANWEVLIDEEANMSLNVSIIDRYDSTPNGKLPNDLDYATTLLWNF